MPLGYQSFPVTFWDIWGEQGHPVRATVADTIGAGDTFNAGVLASLDRQGLLTKDAIAAITPAQIHAALTLGAQAAAVTVSRPGADPPWRHELA